MGGVESAKAYSGFTYPCGGYGVTGYGFGRWVSGTYHIGEDVCSSAGRAVYAAADGTVVYSAKTPDSYRWGNLIMIQSEDGFGGELTTVYGHLSNDRRAGAGAIVTKGQLIGFTGPSYTSENGNWGAHLHFGVRGGAYGSPIGKYNPGISGYKSTTSGWYPGGQVIRERQVVIDYQPASVTVGGARTKKQQYYIDFNLRNTGNTVWHKNGSGAIRLGAIDPADRNSGFSTGQIGQGWSSGNRIALMEDTAPGNVGTFRALFDNTAVDPGHYIEKFAPVIDGKGWLADRGLKVDITVQPPQYRSQWVGQGIYTDISPTNTSHPDSAQYVTPGQRLNAKAYLRNVGDYQWKSSGSNPVRLGTTYQNDRNSPWATTGVGSIPASENWLSGNRASNIDGRLKSNGSITPTDTINPGETAVFSFAITAPNIPANFKEYFNPVVEGVGWMNDVQMWYGPRVLPDGYHYAFVGQEEPDPIQLGRTADTAKLYLRNMGQTNWPVGGNVKLGTDRNRDRASAFSEDWPAPNRATSVDANVTNPGDTIIRPGNVAEFKFDVKSESVRDGSYQEYLKPLAEGVTWMPEDYGIYMPVKVQSPARDYKVITQTYSTDVGNLHPGQKFSTQLTVRNVGSLPWNVDGTDPIRLATNRPQDRNSGFSTLAGLDPWISTNRASKIDGKVMGYSPLQTAPTSVINQSEVAYLNIPMKVPNVSYGLYQEYFNFVQEGQSWFPDLGIMFPFVVSGN